MNSLFQSFKVQLNTFWSGLNDSKRKLLIFGTIAVIIFALISAFFLNQTRYVVLFSGMDTQEASEVFLRLQEIGIQPRIEGVSTILVPEEMEAELRMQLTAEGFPRSGFNYDILNMSNGLGQFGQTDSDRRLTQILQLQERLSQSIMFLDSVEDAVVTIAMPETNQFVLRDQEIPVTASVIISPAVGHSITEFQAQNIEQLVARSVPGLNPENITIIDKNANMLNRRVENQQPTDNFNLEQQMEERLNQQVIALLEPVFGLGRVVSRVNVKLNFDRRVVESVRFEPVVDDAGIIVSREELRERVTGAAAGGIIGETPNVTQYPVADAEGTGGESDRRQEIVNYEVNEIKERIEHQQGNIEDLSISVIIDNEELDDAAIVNVTDLVAKAVGTDTERISVQAMGFDVSLQDALREGFEQRRVGIPFDLNLVIFAGLAFLLLLAGIFFMRKRKILSDQKLLTQSSFDVSTDKLNLPAVDLENDAQDQIKGQLEKLATQRPDALAQLLRNWLTEE